MNRTNEKKIQTLLMCICLQCIIMIGMPISIGAQGELYPNQMAVPYVELVDDEGLAMQAYIEEQIELRAEAKKQEYLEFKQQEIADINRGIEEDYNTYIKSITNPTNITKASNLTKEQMKKVLDVYNRGDAIDAFYKNDTNGVNFMFSLAVSIQESGRKRESNRARTINDIFGITSVGYTYNTVNDCVNYFGDFITRLYTNKGRTTVEEIGPIYCPSGPAYWVQSVRKIMDEIYQVSVNIARKEGPKYYVPEE